MILRITDVDGIRRVVDASGKEVLKDAYDRWTIGENIEVDATGATRGVTNSVVFGEELTFVEILSPNGTWTCFDA